MKMIILDWMRTCLVNLVIDTILEP